MSFDHLTNSKCSEWHFHTIGLPADGRSFGELLPAMQRTLRDILPKITVVENHNGISSICTSADLLNSSQHSL
jgi:hypothetical protein